MAAEVKFTRGNTSFTLTASPYAVGLDFCPPGVNASYNISAGTSANRTGGGKLIGDRYNNRPFSFTVRILAASMTDAGSKARALSAYVKASTADPLYLEYREDSSLPVPLWGQFGAPLRYEVVTADVGNPSENYTRTQGRGFSVPVTLEVGPLAHGNAQRACRAAGGIFENNYGTTDLVPRGLSMFVETTNKMTNPVFSHATYSNGWTASTSFVVNKNVDPAYCLPGVFQSVKIVALADVNPATYTQSIAAGNANKHSFSSYVMRPDKGTVTSADVVNFYGGAELASTFQDLGNGLWLVYSDDETGIIAAADAGISVKDNRSIYFLGFQLEEKTYHTPLAYGDLLGCAWTGTAHASTTTRTSPLVNILRDETIISIAAGGVSFVWKPYYSNTHGVTETLFRLYKTDYTASGLSAYFNSADDKFYLTDGTNVISTAAQTFSGGDTIHLVFVWGVDGLVIYKNGVSVASGATYGSPASVNQAILLIGSVNGANACNGDILGFDIYEQAPTAAQALALYTAQAAVIAGGGRVSSIPWLYTKDGDSIVDAVNDSTRDNWACAGGVQGSAPAKTQWNLRGSAASLYASPVTISNLDVPYFINPFHFWSEKNGTADATSSAGEYYQLSMTSPDTQTAYINPLKRDAYALSGRELIVFARMYDAGTTLALTPYVKLGGTYYGETINRAIGTTFSLEKTRSIFFPDVRWTFNTLDVPAASELGIYIQRATGGAANVRIDYACIMARPMMTIAGGSSNAEDGIIIEGSKYQDYDVATTVGGINDISITGDVLELVPNNYNILISVIGKLADAVIANTLTYYAVTITPRYTLL